MTKSIYNHNLRVSKPLSFAIDDSELLVFPHVPTILSHLLIWLATQD